MLSYLSTAGSSLTIQAGAIVLLATYQDELCSVLLSLRWPLLFIVILVLTDLWSGLAANVRLHRQTFRLSRALRRTLVKLCEYVSMIIFFATLCKAILEPFGICQPLTGGGVGAAFALLCEADSIISHLLELHGCKTHFSLRRFLLSYVKHKNKNLGTALEETIAESETSNNKHQTSNNKQ